MKIFMVTPAPPGSLKGNRVTALRWAHILRGLGHQVLLKEEYHRGNCDLLIALHARRSYESIKRFRERLPGRPLIVVLTGTDLYRDLETAPEARQSLEWADRIVALHPAAGDSLPPHLRDRLRVIVQSAPAPRRRVAPREDLFEVCVIGHLRPVKDPFRAALAARLLPESSRIRIIHLGDALSPGMERQARSEMMENPRYRWLGPLSRRECLARLSGSRILVLSSEMEGGANVISEALAASIPILSSRIPGSTGLLGDDYPGLFPVGDTEALASLLHRAETDRAFYTDLQARCRRLAALVDPCREREAWRDLTGEIEAIISSHC